MVSSVIYKQIRKFKETLKESIDYIDLNYRGIDDLESVTITGGKCILDAFQIWLISDINSYHRQPNKGGFLAKNVVKKPFKDESCDEIQSKLLVEANSAFPSIKIEKCTVTCNQQTRKWEIRITAFDRDTLAISQNITAEVPSKA